MYQFHYANGLKRGKPKTTWIIFYMLTVIKKKKQKKTTPLEMQTKTKEIEYVDHRKNNNATLTLNMMRIRLVQQKT